MPHSKAASQEQEANKSMQQIRSRDADEERERGVKKERKKRKKKVTREQEAKDYSSLHLTACVVVVGVILIRTSRMQTPVCQRQPHAPPTGNHTAACLVRIRFSLSVSVYAIEREREREGGRVCSREKRTSLWLRVG